MARVSRWLKDLLPRVPGAVRAVVRREFYNTVRDFYENSACIRKTFFFSSEANVSVYRVIVPTGYVLSKILRMSYDGSEISPLTELPDRYVTMTPGTPRMWLLDEMGPVSETTHLVPQTPAAAFVNPPLLNNWGQTPDSNVTQFAVSKDNTTGQVFLRGRIQYAGFTPLPQAFVLPQGYRPERNRSFYVEFNNLDKNILIFANGGVEPQGNPLSSFHTFNLDGISFAAVGFVVPDSTDVTKVRLIPTPATAVVNAIGVAAVMLPDPTLGILPEVSARDHYDALMEGTLFRLYTHPNKPYTNLLLAEAMGRKYRAAIGKYAGLAKRGGIPAAAAWTFPRFGK